MVTFDSPKACRPNACLCQRETFSPQKLHGATAGAGQSANGIRQSESFLFAREGPAGAEFALLFAVWRREAKTLLLRGRKIAHGIARHGEKPLTPTLSP
jgi:hypothetical protein